MSVNQLTVSSLDTGGQQPMARAVLGSQALALEQLK